MRTLRRYEDEYKRLEIAAFIMNYVATQNGYRSGYYVGRTYFDLGQDWKWTTIIYECEGSSFQALSPIHWKKITNGTSIDELSALCEKLVDEQRDIITRQPMAER